MLQRWFILACGPVLLGMGCAPSATVEEIQDISRAGLAVVVPASLSIVGEFTRLSDFDNDDAADGLELSVRSVNIFGDPVLAGGSLRVELFAYRPASGEPAGHKVRQWDVALHTADSQRRYWNRVTSLYELRLEAAEGIDPVEKYLVRLTYANPLSERITEDYVLEPPIRAGVAGGGSEM